MLKIKLARFGKRNQPHYRIVVNEARDKRDGSYVALVGHYAPTQEPKLLDIDVKAFDEWVAKGAQPTDTVANLYERLKSGTPFPAKKNSLSKKAKAKLAAAKEEKQAADEAAKTAAEEPKTEEKPEEATVETTDAATEPETATEEPAA
jgi:small subunit ribosomal protein S16